MPCSRVPFSRCSGYQNTRTVTLPELLPELLQCFTCPGAGTKNPVVHSPGPAGTSLILMQPVELVHRLHVPGLEHMAKES